MENVVDMRGDSLQNLRNHVLEYHQNGWNVIPVKYKGKSPIGKDWQKGVTASTEYLDQQLSFGICNLGLLLGKEVIDIDLDCAEARYFAPKFLPITLSFGRKSSENSHLIYSLGQMIDKAATLKFTWPKSLKVEEEHATILELRGQTESGNYTQTVIPPSIHPSGEEITWNDSLSKIREIPSLKLIDKGVRYTAIASFLAKIWNSSQRENLTGALTGWMLKMGEDSEKVRDLLDEVIRYVGDEEHRSRLNYIDNTIVKYENGGEVSGIGAIEKELGKPLAEWLIKTLGDDGLLSGGFQRPNFEELQYKDLPILGVDENYRHLIYVQDLNRYVRIIGGNFDREPSLFDQQHVGNAYRTYLGKTAGEIIRNSVPDVVTMGYAPGDSILTIDSGTGETILNTWRGPVREPAEKVNPEEISLFENHLLALCCGREREAELLTAWLAYLIQHNQSRCTWGVLFIGGEGTGKGTILTIMREILGISNVTSRTASSAMKDETFNGWLSSKRLVAIEEIMMGRISSVKLGNAIKEWITEERVLIRKMRKEPISFPNYAQFLFTTNNENALHLTEGNRRLMVLRNGDSMYGKSSHEVREDNESWLRNGEYFTWLDNGGYEQIYRYLIDFDTKKVKEFDPRMAPMTLDKTELVHGTQTEVFKHIEEGIESYDYPFEKDLIRPKEIAKWLKEDFSLRVNVSEIKQALKSLKAVEIPSEQCRRKLNGKNRKFATWCIRNWKEWKLAKPSERFNYVVEGEEKSYEF